MESITVAIWVLCLIFGAICFALFKLTQKIGTDRRPFIKFAQELVDGELLDSKFIAFKPIYITGKYRSCEVKFVITGSIQIQINSDSFPEVKGFRLSYENTSNGFQIHNKSVFKTVYGGELAKLKTKEDLKNLIVTAIDEAIEIKNT